MSEILSLAQKLEAESKQLAKRIEQESENALKQHNDSISAALKSSANSIESAIHAQSQQQSQLLWGLSAKIYLWILVTTVALMLLAGSVFIVMGWMIEDRYQTLTQLNQSLVDLEQKTGGGIKTFANPDQKNGHFIVLPKTAHNTNLYRSQSGEWVLSYRAK